MIRSKNPNRFFGVNPAAIPNQGRQLVPWSKELPRDWRSALAANAADDAEAVEMAESEGDYQGN